MKHRQLRAALFYALISLSLLDTATLANRTCTLCSGGQQISQPDKQVKMDWPISVPNCSMLNQYAISLEENSTECNNVQSIGTICGCPVPENACSLCPDGSNVTLQNKTLPFLANSFGGVAPSCELFGSYLHSVNASSPKCQEAQATSSACGCATAQDACTICRDGESVTTPNRNIPQFQLSLEAWDLNPPTCELIEAIVLGLLKNDSKGCSELQSESFLCGCSYPDKYWKRQAILAWLPRISAPLSFFGSSFIIYDVLKRPKNQRTMQHQLLLFMSIIDCMSSVAWALSTLPIPATDDDGNSYHIYGARGNDATCTAQGFFIQLGLTTPFYNLTLAVYYLLIILYGWTEHQLSKVRYYLYVVPLLVGLGLAFGGIPFYQRSANMCYINSGEPYRNILIFMVIPISTVILLATVIMVMIYVKVYHQERTVRQWTTRGQQSNVQTLPKKVFWQSFWYLMCFYVSWPILVVIQFVDADLFLNYWFLCLAMIIAPIQGFLNFITYTRRRFQRYMKERHFSSWKLLRQYMSHSTNNNERDASSQTDSSPVESDVVTVSGMLPDNAAATKEPKVKSSIEPCAPMDNSSAPQQTVNYKP